MKKLITFLCVITLKTTLIATSLIYTGNQTNYQAQHYVFRKNDTAQGFVRLNNGFTVLADSNASMDLLFSVSGAIDLRDTATMTLLNDLVCDSGVTLSSGGNIKGFGRTIFLNGNLTIPASKVLHISGNTIINGKGNKLTIGANAQIFVDTNATLTLCNMSITNQQHAPTYPPIRCGAQTSKLALDNVVFTPVGDFLFPQGQLFIHDDVMVTGTSAFIYTSPMTSFITSGACWFFGINTTFSVAPATFTDAPYSLNNTYTNNNFIRMADSTSILHLDSCSLQTTNTGCRFSKGTIAFDNKITCRSDTTLTLTSVTLRASQNYGSFATCVAWSPDGKYLAVGGLSPTSGYELQVYSFNGVSLALLSGAQVDYGNYIADIDWSPDGRYLAVSGYGPTSGYEEQAYSFNGTSLTLISDAQVDYGAGVSVSNWSRDGRYLAIGGESPISGYNLQVYSFTGTKLSSVVQPVSGFNIYTLRWSPDGKYLAVGWDAPTSGYELQLYSFDGKSLALVAQIDYGAIVLSVSWSPDGRYLAIGGMTPLDAYEVKVYRFNGTSLTLLSNTQIDNETRVYSVEWSPDGLYLALAGWIPPSGYPARIYAFDGTTLTLIPGAQITYGLKINWRPDGRYLAVVGESGIVGHKEIEVYKCNYANNTIPQAISNSIIFGDSTKGSTYDAHVNILAGSHVNLAGTISYDCLA